jgi:hypothetical protein
LLDADFVVFPIEDRLAPETKLPAIIEDERDAFRWLRSRGKSLEVDADRLAVCGSSAGGYLTPMRGFCVDPRPGALVSYVLRDARIALKLVTVPGGAHGIGNIAPDEQKRICTEPANFLKSHW